MSIHTAEMSIAEMKAHIARLEQEAESATRETIRPTVEHLLTRHTPQPSSKEGSTWVGFSEKVTVTIEGQRYSVNIVVTDVAASEQRKAERKAATDTAKAAEKRNQLLAQLAQLEKVAAGS